MLYLSINEIWRWAGLARRALGVFLLRKRWISLKIALTNSTFETNPDNLTTHSILREYLLRYAVFLCLSKLCNTDYVLRLISWVPDSFLFVLQAGRLQGSRIWEWLYATRHLRSQRLLKFFFGWYVLYVFYLSLPRHRGNCKILRRFKIRSREFFLNVVETFIVAC